MIFNVYVNLRKKKEERNLNPLKKAIKFSFISEWTPNCRINELNLSIISMVRSKFHI